MLDPPGKMAPTVNLEPRKGGFSTGGFCVIPVSRPRNENIERYWAQQHLECNSQQTHTFCKSPSKNPLFLVPESMKISKSPFFVAKTCAPRPVFARVAQELWTADPSECPMGHEASASSGEQSGAPWRSWKPGHQQHPGAENQDNHQSENVP